jgi:hypothetical protein
MPAQFNKLGIRFTYPDNWTVDETSAMGGAASVTVYSPTESFWSVSLHPDDVEPEVLVRSGVAALRETYPDIDVEEIRDTMQGREVIGADVNFICLDLTNTAQIRVFEAANCVVVVYCQADDRDFDALGPVFQAMTFSLLAGMPARIDD